MALQQTSVAAVEEFQVRLAHREHNGRRISPRTGNKVLIVLHGIFERARREWSLALNPAVEIERHPGRSSGDIEVCSPEEIWALVRSAGDERDAAIYAIAAFTGLRIRRAQRLHWRNVDFARSVIRVRASYAQGELGVPNSGKVHSVPMVADVGRHLAA
jgi:integrase